MQRKEHSFKRYENPRFWHLSVHICKMELMLLPSSLGTVFPDRCQVQWYLPQKNSSAGSFEDRKCFFSVPPGFSPQRSLSPTNSYSLDNRFTIRLHSLASSSLRLTGGERSDCIGECVPVTRAFPTQVLSSGEQLTAALIITRLTPPLHNFNTSFYAGIWGCVCLWTICNEKKKKSKTDLQEAGRRGAQSPRQRRPHHRGRPRLQGQDCCLGTFKELFDLLLSPTWHQFPRALKENGIRVKRSIVSFMKIHS